MRKQPTYILWLFLSLTILACQSKTDSPSADNEAGVEDSGTGVPISYYIDAKNESLGLGEAHFGLKQFGRAADEYEVANDLKPGNVKLMFSLAEAQFRAGEKEAARKTLERLLKKDPDHAGGRELLKRL